MYLTVNRIFNVCQSGLSNIWLKCDQIRMSLLYCGWNWASNDVSWHRTSSCIEICVLLGLYTAQNPSRVQISFELQQKCEVIHLILLYIQLELKYLAMHYPESSINQKMTERPITFHYSINCQHPVPIQSLIINYVCLVGHARTHTCMHTHTHTMLRQTCCKGNRQCGRQNKTVYQVTN